MSDYTDHERLFLLLDQAEQFAAQRSGGYSTHFGSARDFHQALAGAIAQLKAGDREQLEQLRLLVRSNWCLG